YLTKASTSACTGCHDDANPSEMTTGAGPPGTNHVPGAQPEAFCATICHVAAPQREFDISVPGAHTVPERSTQLKGLVGELLSASGGPPRPVPAEERGRHAAHDPHRSRFEQPCARDQRPVERLRWSDAAGDHALHAPPNQRWNADGPRQ